jgi:Tfp pilus assembly protein PilO
VSRRFPKPGLAIGTLAVTVAALVGGFVFVVQPQRHDSAKLAAQIADAQAELDAAQTSGGAQQDIQPIRIADLFQLSRAMPDTPDSPDVLLQLSQIANETGITFKSITPGDPILVGSYQKLPIDLVFEGRFYDLSDFLYRLRNLVGVHDGELDAVGRLFSVDSISFSEGDEAAFPQVQAQLEVDAYMFGDGTQTSAPAVDLTPAATDAAQAAAGPERVPSAAPGISTGPLP